MYHDGHDNQWLWLMVFYCLYQQLTAAKWLFHVPVRRCVPIYNLTKCTVRNNRLLKIIIILFHTYTLTNKYGYVIVWVV